MLSATRTGRARSSASSPSGRRSWPFRLRVVVFSSSAEIQVPRCHLEPDLLIGNVFVATARRAAISKERTRRPSQAGVASLQADAYGNLPDAEQVGVEPVGTVGVWTPR